MLNGKKVIVIITGGIAAYKSLELVRKLTQKGVKVIPVMTKAAENFVTPMAVSAPVSYTHLRARDQRGSRMPSSA